MTLFPFYENIDNKWFLVVGGGAIAQEKIEKLKMFTDNIIVVALRTLIDGVDVMRKSFEDEDINLGDYVIAATSDKELNRRISLLCKIHGKPCNVVDDPELCTFFFPSMVKKGKLVVSISTMGASPAYAKRLRKDIEKTIPENIEEILDRMAECRTLVASKVDDQKTRSRIYKRMLDTMMESNQSISNEEIDKIIEEEA